LLVGLADDPLMAGQVSAANGWALMGPHRNKKKKGFISRVWIEGPFCLLAFTPRSIFLADSILGKCGFVL